VHREQCQLPGLNRFEFFQIVYHLQQNLPRIAMLRCFETPKLPSIILTCRNVSLGVLLLSLRSSKHIRCSLLQPNATLASSKMFAVTFSYLQFRPVQVFQKRTLFDKAFPNWNASTSVRAYLVLVLRNTNEMQLFLFIWFFIIVHVSEAVCVHHQE